jgi:hypothetical protein
MLDYQGAIYDFILYCANQAQAPLSSDNVFRAWPNRVSLPKASNEFAVITPISLVSKGTNTYRYLPVDEVMILSSLYLADLQIDFWGNDLKVFDRASALLIISQSPYGTDFFKLKNMSVIECPGGIRDLSSPGEDDQYVKRASLTLRVEFWDEVKVDQWGTPGPLSLKYFENVDVHHPPVATGDK